MLDEDSTFRRPVAGADAFEAVVTGQVPFAERARDLIDLLFGPVAGTVVSRGVMSPDRGAPLAEAGTYTIETAVDAVPRRHFARSLQPACSEAMIVRGDSPNFPPLFTSPPSLMFDITRYVAAGGMPRPVIDGDTIPARARRPQRLLSWPLLHVRHGRRQARCSRPTRPTSTTAFPCSRRRPRSSASSSPASTSTGDGRRRPLPPRPAGRARAGTRRPPRVADVRAAVPSLALA